MFQDLSVESVRNAQERVPAEERIARRSEREGGAGAEAGEYVVEKILAKRFNPRRKHYEYLLKWEGYPQWVSPYLLNSVYDKLHQPH